VFVDGKTLITPKNNNNTTAAAAAAATTTTTTATAQVPCKPLNVGIQYIVTEQFALNTQ
jgi:hypothetical protein